MAAGNTYVALATETLVSAQASVTFSSISGAYTDLVIIAQAGVTVVNNAGYMQVGNNSVDTGSNYSTTYLIGNGTNASSGRYTSSSIGVSFYQPGYGTPTVLTASGVSNIMNYANTNTYKTVISRSGAAGSSTEIGVGTWRSTAAINIITLYPEASTTWVSGSIFTLYGIAAA